MRLWHLLPKKVPKSGVNPWRTVYDCSFGFVVRAKNETDARTFASKEGGDENPRYGKTGDKSPWLDPGLSSCEPLSALGAPGIIIQDFNAG